MKKNKLILRLILLLFIILVIGIVAFFIVNQTSPGNIYPDTDQAPILEFFWDGELTDENIVRITPYGILEGGDQRFEPAVEIQFYTKSSHDPVLAPASGVITEMHEGRASLTVRYGKNYGYTMHHIVDFPEGLSKGDKVEPGDLLGYTELRNGTGWWEVELNVKRGDVYRTLPAYDYFSPEGKKALDEILAGQDLYFFPSWTIRESYTTEHGYQEKSWIEIIGSDEWWTSSQRIGYNDWTESEEDFMRANNIVPEDYINIRN